MRPEYYEGKLQLRNPSEKVLDYVEDAIARDGKVFIAKKDRLKNGYDLQLSSQNFLRNIGRKLQDKFSGELMLSSKLAGRSKSGKDLYRVNVLFRMYSFRKGSTVTYRGESYKVLETAHRVRIKSIETGKSITVGYGDIS